ncbi:MAG: hypothetical protein ACI9WU_000208 [Myxococcota bacterium]
MYNSAFLPGREGEELLMKWLLNMVVVVALSASTAMAAPPANPDGKAFDFETDEVTVDVLKPDATMVEVLRAKARQSLIRIRMDFVKEIVRSAEDI